MTVQWLDSSGNTRPILPVPGNYLSPTLSPDGSRLALTSGGDIWVYELGRGSMTRLTFGGGYRNAIWSADSRYIVSAGRGAGRDWVARDILSVRADGTAQPQVLTQGIPLSFTGNGKRLVFNKFSPANIDDIWTVPVETGSSGLRAGKPELFLQAPFHERGPMFSPDGRWLAYQSNESGTYEVYVQGFPDGHGKRRISRGGGAIPAWSHNGRDLFFRNGYSQLMVASYQARGDSFVVEAPRVWFEKRPPDGKHIVALMPADTPEEPRDC